MTNFAVISEYFHSNNNMKPLIEKTWITKNGLKAHVVFNNLVGHRCGYVGVNEDHILYKTNYDELDGLIEGVHGGLTFSDFLNHIGINDNLWYFGYDCGHGGDKNKFNKSGVERTLDFCKMNCELLADQLNLSLLNTYFKAKYKKFITEQEHNEMLARAIVDSDNYYVKNYFIEINK